MFNQGHQLWQCCLIHVQLIHRRCLQYSLSDGCATSECFSHLRPGWCSELDAAAALNMRKSHGILVSNRFVWKKTQRLRPHSSGKNKRYNSKFKGSRNKSPLYNPLQPGQKVCRLSMFQTPLEFVFFVEPVQHKIAKLRDVLHPILRRHRKLMFLGGRHSWGRRNEV